MKQCTALSEFYVQDAHLNARLAIAARVEAFVHHVLANACLRRWRI